jgi:hypothetical protein
VKPFALSLSSAVGVKATRKVPSAASAVVPLPIGCASLAPPAKPHQRHHQGISGCRVTRQATLPEVTGRPK